MDDAREREADHEEVLELGGLYVVGTERHEARRIDNQLRGRSGRQGDPGQTRFFLSGADDLVRLFAGDRIQNIMARFKVAEDQRGGGDPHEADRERAEEGRGAELRHAQERPQVRRRDEQAALGDLRAAPGRARGQDLSDEVRQWIDEVIGGTVDQFATDEAEGWDLDQMCEAMRALRLGRLG